MQQIILKVAIDAPLDSTFDYRWLVQTGSESAPQVGQLVQVPFGRRMVIGMVTAVLSDTEVHADRLKDIVSVRDDIFPVTPEWLDLCAFAAGYYQRPLGEVAIPSLPKQLRTLRAGKVRQTRRTARKKSQSADVATAQPEEQKPVLNEAQSAAVSHILSVEGFLPIVLHGVTGSGKTEVYLQVFEQVLAKDPAATVMILVPEINLTPQLESSIRARFPDTEIAVLHSRLSEGEREQNWLSAHQGRARILLGTRMAIFASVPSLALIVVDEEHDPSYKQQEGLRYSARDLAVWRARQLNIPVVLGSATPSAESWYNARTGRYHKLTLPERAVRHAELPSVRLVDTSRERLRDGFSAVLIDAINERLSRNEQSLLFLNRRGYAPVLMCEACGWVSSCKRCSAYMVLHKPQRMLCCHHCSLELYIPRSCPTCGFVDLKPLGRGTQRIEESLQHFFPEASVLRIDADSTRKKDSLSLALESVHRGDVDILVGTQMLAKGHDFSRLTLVGVLNPDIALFSHDYRAGERLFAQLMQVGGRAGRRAATDSGKSEVLIQTRYPQHPLYQSVLKHDYDGFVHELLAEREQAGLPPFSHQVLLCAQARQLEVALAFLREAKQLAEHPGIEVNDPVPMSMVRVGGMERAQLLVGAVSRVDMQQFLRPWVAQLRLLKTRASWYIEVDPASI